MTRIRIVAALSSALSSVCMACSMVFYDDVALSTAQLANLAIELDRLGVPSTRKVIGKVESNGTTKPFHAQVDFKLPERAGWDAIDGSAWCDEAPRSNAWTCEITENRHIVFEGQDVIVRGNVSGSDARQKLREIFSLVGSRARLVPDQELTAPLLKRVRSMTIRSDSVDAFLGPCSALQFIEMESPPNGPKLQFFVHEG